MAFFGRLKQLSTVPQKTSTSTIENSSFSDKNSKEVTWTHADAAISKDILMQQVALLTPREHDLFLLLLEGYTLKEAAENLSIKYSTANTHMTGIYKKLKINTRAALIINYRIFSEHH